jgi:hypothetical protein
VAFAQQGHGGEFRAGPIRVARFGAWTLVRPDDVLGSDGALINPGPVAVLDSFRWAHDRLDVWLDCGRAWWVWRGVVAQQDNWGEWRTGGGRPEIRVK